MFTKEISFWEAVLEWVNIPVLVGCVVVGGVWMGLAVRRSVLGVWQKRLVVVEEEEGSERVGGLGYDKEIPKSALFVVGGSKGFKSPRLFYLPFSGVSSEIDYQAASGRLEMAKYGAGIQVEAGLGFVVGGMNGRDTPLQSVVKMWTDRNTSAHSIHMDSLKPLPKPRLVAARLGRIEVGSRWGLFQWNPAGGRGSGGMLRWSA